MAELAPPVSAAAVVPKDIDTIEEIVELMHTKIGHASYAELLRILRDHIKPFLLGVSEVLFYCCLT
jgi:hypothetical protein